MLTSLLETAGGEEEIYGAFNIWQKEHPRSSPCVAIPSLFQAGHEVYAKCETHSPARSFKSRGVTNKLGKALKKGDVKCVAAASTGNHAQATALIAKNKAIKADIFMPTSATQFKVEATKQFGANVHIQGANLLDATEAGQSFTKEHGALFLHAYDDPEIVAGQATLGIEIVKDLPQVDNIVTAIGGGGLISGVALGSKLLKPTVKVYGVQSEAVPSYYHSLQQGKPTDVAFKKTLADAIAVTHPVDHNFEVIKHLVEQVVLVDEDQIAFAMFYAFKYLNLKIEGASATVLAALLFNKLQLTGSTVIIFSGGNVDDTSFFSAIQKFL